MTVSLYCDPTKRHDFVLLFDVTNGNPNGDPDAGNQPRIDPETMHGLVTDVCLKRKVRNWVDLVRGSEDGFKIYVQNRGIGLNEFHYQAHQAVFPGGDEATDVTVEKSEIKRSKGTVKRENQLPEDTAKESAQKRQQARREWLCSHFYDVRTFGAVMSTGDYPSGQVRGPLQLTFARSVDPIFPLDLAITRVAVADVDPNKKSTSTMGRKSMVPYGLYMGYGFFVPHFAKQTNFSSDDLELFWEALQSMWNIDRSASRGMLALQGLFVFSHQNTLGNSHAHHLFERISVKKFDHIEAPRHISDYVISIDDNNLPEGVVMTRLA